MAGLQDQGFRFIYQSGRFVWTHPAEIDASSIDCTDMSDDEFEMFVAVADDFFTVGDRMIRAIQMVESATVLAGQLRTPMCYVCNKPRALVEYALGSVTWQEQEARINKSIQTYYQECRAKGSPAWVGD